MGDAGLDKPGCKKEAVTESSEMSVEEEELARRLKKWVSQQLDSEIARVEACGQKVLKLPVKNCSVVRQDKDMIANRIEIDSGMDFDSVQQILLSEPVPCPLAEKKGFNMCFVVLSTGKPIVLILPYLYDTNVVGNSLQEWLFINRNMKSSHHRVSCFGDSNDLDAIAEEAESVCQDAG